MTEEEKRQLLYEMRQDMKEQHYKDQMHERQLRSSLDYFVDAKVKDAFIVQLHHLNVLCDDYGWCLDDVIENILEQ